MGWARRRGSGRWQAQYRDADGTVRSAGMYGRRSDALAAAGDAEAALRAGTWIDPRGGDTTFGEWAGVWVAAQGGGAATRAQRESFLRVHLLPAFGELPLRGITPLSVQAWIAELNESGYARVTIRDLHKLMSRVMQAAVTERLVSVSPVPRRIPSMGPPAAEKVFLTLEQVLALAGEVPPRYRAMVLLAAGGGLRWGELTGLQVRRLDMLRRRVSIRAVLEEVDGRKTWREYPKSTASRRVVSLPQWVTDALAEHLAEHPPSSPEDGDGRTVPGVVFTTEGGHFLSRNNFRARVWVPAVARAGVPEGVTVHGLRHTHVALCISDGVPPKALQARLGHESITTTLNTYGHLYDDIDDEVAAGLDDRYRRAADGQQMGSRTRGAWGSRRDGEGTIQGV